jgi:hypothetical protein
MPAPDQRGGNIPIRKSLTTGLIGKAAGDPQNPVKARRRNPAFVNHRVEQFTPLCIRRSELAKIFAIKARI